MILTPPSALIHSPTAIEGHVGYPPGHELNPYSSLGLWYYVPNFTPEFLEITSNAAPIDRSKPYFGLSNVSDYLNDLSKFGDLLDPDGEPVVLRNQPALIDGSPGLIDIPVQRALPASGALSLNQINALFGWGTNLNAYRGRRWYTDSGAYGDFPTGLISISHFYGKRPDDPITPGAWDQQGPGYHDFYTPLHRQIGVQRMGAGGGAGAYPNYGRTGEQTWAFSGGSPANGGGGGGFLKTNAVNTAWLDQSFGGGGSWGAPGNANNIGGQGGSTTQGNLGVWYGYTTGKGGDSAWGAGGAAQACYTGSGFVAGNGGTFGSGGGGGMNNNGAGIWFFGDGGGAGGYTYDTWGAGVIGGVVSTYVGAHGQGDAGGWGGAGRIYVNWS